MWLASDGFDRTLQHTARIRRPTQLQRNFLLHLLHLASTVHTLLAPGV